MYTTFSQLIIHPESFSIGPSIQHPSIQHIQWGRFIHNQCIIPRPSVLTFPVFRPGLRSCLLPSSLHGPSPSFSGTSPCWDRDSDSEGPTERLSEPWLRGEEEREGDSRNLLMAGWFSTAGSLLEACWENAGGGGGGEIRHRTRRRFTETPLRRGLS